MRKKTDTFLNQLNNRTTYFNYYNELESLGCNVLNCTLQPYMDKSYFNYKMFYRGSLVIFYDDVMEEVLALPYNTVAPLDIYDRPTIIKAYSKTYNKILKPGEYVIVYDNLMKKPLYRKIEQSAQRLTLIRRVIDINIKQQKTPRIYQCPENQKLTFMNMINQIDSCDDAITTYDSLDLDAVNVILTPAPYVADKLEEEFEKIWSEALRYMGVASVTYEKRERLIKDEVTMSQGGTIANRYNRFNSYKDGFEKANEMFEKYLKRPFEVEFYDGLPTTLVNEESEESEETEVDNYE